MDSTINLDTIPSEIINYISNNELSLKDVISLSACTKKLYEIAGSDFWANMCIRSCIQRQGEICPRERFYAKLRDNDPLAAYALGKLLSNDIEVECHPKFAQTYFDIAFKHSWPHSKLRSSINRHLHELYYLHNAQMSINTISSYILNFSAFHSHKEETLLLTHIENFENHLSTIGGQWLDFHHLAVDTSMNISPKLRMVATSYRCYEWAGHNLPADGEKIFEKLISTPNLPISVQNRIQRLKATRHFLYPDEPSNDNPLITVSDSQAGWILKKASKDKHLSFGERIYAVKYLIHSKLIGKVDDVILTPEECIELAKEIDSYFKIGHSIRTYYMVTCHMVFYEQGQVPLDATINYLRQGLNSKYLHKTIWYYCALSLIKIYDKGLYTFGFDRALEILNMITHDPAINNFGIVKCNKLVSDAIDLLAKYTQLNSVNFRKLSENNKMKIMNSEITDPNELMQEIDLLLAEDYFNSHIFTYFSRAQVIDMLKNIVATPLDSNEELASRWDERSKMALEFLNKHIYANETCLLQ